MNNYPIEACPKCGTTDNIALHGYPIEHPYLCYVYCTKCGFSGEAADWPVPAMENWNRLVAGIQERKATIIKNRDNLIKRGII